MKLKKIAYPSFISYIIVIFFIVREDVLPNTCSKTTQLQQKKVTHEAILQKKTTYMMKLSCAKQDLYSRFKVSMLVKYRLVKVCGWCTRH